MNNNHSLLGRSRPSEKLTGEELSSLERTTVSKEPLGCLSGMSGVKNNTTVAAATVLQEAFGVHKPGQVLEDLAHQ